MKSPSRKRSTGDSLHESATAGFAGGCFQGVDPAQGGEGRLAAQAVGVVPGGDEQGCGVVGTDTVAGQQPRALPGDRVGDVVDKVVDFRGELKDAPRQQPQGVDRRAGDVVGRGGL